MDWPDASAERDEGAWRTDDGVARGLKPMSTPGIIVWESLAGGKQGLHVSASCHLRVRQVKSLAQFSLQDDRACKKEGVFQTYSPTEGDIEKGIAKIGPLGFVLAAERCMVGIRCGDHKRICIGEERYENARIAS